MKGSISLPPIVNSQYISAYHLWEEIKKAYDVKENRERVNVRVRQAFAVALTNETSLTYSAIGSVMDKNHATIIHCRRNHEGNMLYDAHYPELYDYMATRIRDMVIGKTEEVRHMMQKKNYFSNLSVEHYIEAIERKHKRKVEDLEKERDILRRQVVQLTARNERLHEEYARVKNLL